MTAVAAPVAYRRPAEVAPASEAEAQSKWSLEWTYFVVIFATWCFVPLLRRVMDWHNGFYNPIQVVSLLPFVVTFPLVFFVFRRERWARLTPMFKLFAWTWVGALGYGFVVSAFSGNVTAGAYEAIQYLVPMLVGVWLAGQKIEHPRLMRQLSAVFLIFGGLVAAYGLAQFVNPMPWDVLWVEGGGFHSLGNPAPFQIRVFSTLNQAGPAADFCAAAIMLTLPFFSLKRVWIWPFVGILGATLLLTLVRSSWIGLIVGIIAYLFVSPRRLQALPFIAAFVVLLGFLVASLPAFLGAAGNSDVITSRIASLGDVDHDSSALARQTEIADALQQGLETPAGAGLGMIGASSALSSNPTSPSGNNLDSGYMARFIELGWAGFAGYVFVVIGGLAALIASAFRKTDGRKKPVEMLVIIATAAAICAALAWGDAAGDSHLGIDGFLFWIAMGIGFRRPWLQTAAQLPSDTPARARWATKTAAAR